MSIVNNSTTVTSPQRGNHVAGYDFLGSPSMLAIKKLLWIYFILLLFEGALRKWILPSHADLLLLIRDPVVIVIYYYAFGAGIFQLNQRLKYLLMFCIIAIPFAFFGGGFKLIPILYGIRIHFLHFPLIFIFPLVYSYRDVVRAGRLLLLISIPMTIIIVNLLIHLVGN